jgi:predicted dehydrogenase
MNRTRKALALSRRDFLAAAGAAAAFSIVPRHVIGAGQTPPSGKVNLAFVGVGSQGMRVMFGFLKHADIQAVAVCDAIKQANDFPQWGTSEFRNGVRELLGVKTGWEWLSPEAPISLTRTLKVTSGVCGYEPARQIVDAYYAAKTPSGQYKGCKAFQDFRQMLDKQADIDAVVIGTPDHLHATVSIAAMKKGKHVFCQKPMAHNIYEARKMAEVAKQTGVATQVAVGVAASEDTRRLCEWVSSGVAGPIRRVINWSNRPVWPQGIDRPAESMPVPEGMDWDLWLGPAAQRPFHRIYQPFVWRGWHDFGCGALGDMGCYSFDTIFRALKLGEPDSIEGSSSELCEESYPKASLVNFNFPVEGGRPIELSWYDGGLLPRTPRELAGGATLDKEGLIFGGSSASILCEFTGGKPRLLSAEKKDFPEPPKTLPRSAGLEREWIEACKGNKEVQPAANFEFSAKVTAALCLGNIAVRTGKRLSWDSAAMKITGSDEAQKLVRREYRSGWDL